MLLVIKNLREIAERFRAGGALPEDLALWLERSLREFLDHRCHSLDEAVGLRFAKGGVPWWLEEGMRVRDAALRALAERFLAGHSTSARASRIREMSERYAAANWLADREQSVMPQRYCGTAKEFLWHAFKSGAPMPLGERRLRSVLAGGMVREACLPGPSAPPLATGPLRALPGSSKGSEKALDKPASAL